jgi:predicted nucleic acid-binding protein
MAVRFALDTSAYSAFGRGEKAVRGLFDSAEAVFVPLIVCGELRAGFAAGRRSERNNALLDRFLEQPFVDVLYLSDRTALVYAEIFAGLRRASKPIGTNDMWIAALCGEYELPLATTDRDFAAIAGLELVDIATR